MDRAERILSLYLQLNSGTGVNKYSFSEESGITERTFDRDVRDIRNFLADNYSANEVIYDKSRSLYYLSGVSREKLTDVELSILLTILTSTRVLRKDEMEGVILQLAGMTERGGGIPRETFSELLRQYPETVHEKAMMKMNWDLLKCIQEKKVIEACYRAAKEDPVWILLIPLRVYCEKDDMMLLAADIRDKDQWKEMRLKVESIDSFKVVRPQTFREEELSKKIKSKGE